MLLFVKSNQSGSWIIPRITRAKAVSSLITDIYIFSYFPSLIFALTRFSFCQNLHADGAKTPEGSEESKERNTAIPKKRLLLSVSEREKLLNWDVPVTSEEAPNNTKNTRQHKEQVEFVVRQGSNIETRVIPHMRRPSPLYLSAPLPSPV